MLGKFLQKVLSKSMLKYSYRNLLISNTIHQTQKQLLVTESRVMLTSFQPWRKMVGWSFLDQTRFNASLIKAEFFAFITAWSVIFRIVANIWCPLNDFFTVGRSRSVRFAQRGQYVIYMFKAIGYPCLKLDFQPAATRLQSSGVVPNDGYTSFVAKSVIASGRIIC